MTEQMKENKELDVWIEQLNDCKQLSENQVKTLCEKVIILFYLTCSVPNGILNKSTFLFKVHFNACAQRPPRVFMNHTTILINTLSRHKIFP